MSGGALSVSLCSKPIFSKTHQPWRLHVYQHLPIFRGGLIEHIRQLEKKKETVRLVTPFPSQLCRLCSDPCWKRKVKSKERCAVMEHRLSASLQNLSESIWRKEACPEKCFLKVSGRVQVQTSWCFGSIRMHCTFHARNSVNALKVSGKLKRNWTSEFLKNSFSICDGQSVNNRGAGRWHNQFVTRAF